MTRLERGPEVAVSGQLWKKTYQLECRICSVMCDSVLMAGTTWPCINLSGGGMDGGFSQVSL